MAQIDTIPPLDETTQDILSHLQTHPDDLSLACVPVSSPRQNVYHRFNEVFPLASVGKIPVMIAYAEQLVAGNITRDERVSIRELNRYDLPGTNTGSHERFLETLPDSIQQITLWEVAAEGMMEYSSNAATDFVLMRLQETGYDMPGLLRRLGMTMTTAPHPYLWIPLMMGNHETPAPDPEMLDVAALQEQAQRQMQLFLDDAKWYEAEVAYRLTTRRRGFPDWTIQRAVLSGATMQGTAADMVRLLMAIYGDSGALTPGVRQMVMTALSRTHYESIQRDFRVYGAKTGYYSGGVATIAAYGQTWEGQPVIVVMLVESLPIDIWRTIVREDSLAVLARWLIQTDCAPAQRLLTAPEPD